MSTALTRSQQLEAYRRMVRIRIFEEEGIRLFKAGEIPGAYHASIGQEGAIVGACMALRDTDAMTGTHRSHGHPIGKGAELKALMAELMGKETGICKGRGGSMHLADAAVGIIGESAIVGGGIPLATGVALAAKVRGNGQVCLCFFGDGAVNQGTFHESINMGSLWKLPVIYFCENNGYALTTALTASHAQPSISHRADAYGIPGVAVDGQDVEAVYTVTHAAVGRARDGHGPTLIEAKTYRFDEHEVGLVVPGRPYRSQEELEHQKIEFDPISLYTERLAKRGVGEAALDSIAEEVAAEVADAIRFGRDSRFPGPETLYDYSYAQPV